MTASADPHTMTRRRSESAASRLSSTSACSTEGSRADRVGEQVGQPIDDKQPAGALPTHVRLT